MITQSQINMTSLLSVNINRDKELIKKKSGTKVRATASERRF